MTVGDPTWTPQMGGGGKWLKAAGCGLTPPNPNHGLPRPLGEPEQVTDGKGTWHVHNGGWFPDGQSVVYTRDTDQANIYVLEPLPRRSPRAGRVRPPVRTCRRKTET